MKKYFFFLALLMLLFQGSLVCAAPPGTVMGFNASDGVYLPVSVNSDVATYPHYPSAFPVGTALGYNAASNSYQPLPVDASGALLINGGASSLNELNDVTVTNATNGQYLTYDGGSSNWVNTNAAAGTAFPLPDLTDVSITSLSDKQILQYDSASGFWKNEEAPSGGSVDTATITAAIDDNAASITLNVASITSLRSDVDANSASTTLNTSNIAANAASITLNIASITALEATPPEWTASGSTQIYTEKSVGIGTSTPDVNYKLDVVGDSAHQGRIKIVYFQNDLADPQITIKSGTSEGDIGMGGNNYFNFGVNGTRILNLHPVYGVYNDIGISAGGFGFWTRVTGSEGSPCYSNNVDTDTGIFFPATNNFAVTTDGTEAARFTDNQNLLLGSKVDDGINRLQVTGSVKISDVLKLTPQAAPSSPSEGWIYQDSSDHHLYVYNGTAWVQLDN